MYAQGSTRDDTINNRYNFNNILFRTHINAGTKATETRLSPQKQQQDEKKNMIKTLVLNELLKGRRRKNRQPVMRGRKD